jgi:FlaG/FlaF family flagellin (archaellin)
MRIKKNRRDGAVSPVVGVLLMLVITIIIAAVVSGFAGGLTRASDKTPQAALDAMFLKTSGGGELVIRHLSGDSINTANTEIITSWRDANGTVHFARTSPIGDTATECAFTTTGLDFRCNAISNTSGPTSSGATPTHVYHEPYLMVPGTMPGTLNEHPELSWGNFVMSAGDVAKAVTVFNAAASWSTPGWNNNYVQDHRGDDGLPLVKDHELITSNNILNFKLVDTLSGGTIYEKNLRVQ